MPRLRLLRHAKSSWDDPKRSDEERPLNKRGRRDAPRMARWLVENTEPPRKLVISPARRTRETADAIIAAFGLPGDAVVIDKRLYLADPGMILTVATEHGFDNVLVIGHNPGLHDVACRLAAKHEVPRLEHFPTAAYLELDFKGPVTPGSGVISRFITPKELPDA